MSAVLRRLVGDLTPGALAGAFFLLAAGSWTASERSRTALLAIGALIGISIVLLVRLFRVAPWAYPLAGFLAGPVPLALIADRGAGRDEGLQTWFASALLGGVIGALEWARVARSGPRPG